MSNADTLATLFIETKSGTNQLPVTAGQTISLKASVGEHYWLESLPEGAEQIRIGDDLVVIFADGSRIVLEDFYDICADEEDCSFLIKDDEDAIGIEKWVKLAGAVGLYEWLLDHGSSGNTVVGPGALDLATASDSGDNTSDNLTNDDTPTIRGTGGISGDTVTLYDSDGTTVLGRATVAPDGSWSIDSTTLTHGDHDLKATYTDPAGNESDPSSALTVTIDTMAPAAPGTLDLATASDSGDNTSDDLTNDDTPTITGTGGTPGDTVTLYDSDGTTVLGRATVAPDGSWSIDSTTLTHGDHDLTATYTDPAGNESDPSDALTVTIDTMAPAAPGTLDLATASDSGDNTSDDLTNDDTPTITGTGGTPGDTVTLYDSDGTTVLGTATVAPDGSWSIDSTTLTHGDHDLTATYTDPAGNESDPSDALTVTIDTMAPAAPGTPDLATASDSGDNTSDDLTNDDTPTITGTGGTPGDTVTLYDSDGTTVLGRATVAPDGSWSIDSTTLTHGDHDLTATYTDPAGNESDPSSALTVTIDTMAPAAPGALDLATASDSGDNTSDDLTNDDTPTITGTGGTPGDTVTLYDSDGTTVLGRTTVAPDGSWSIDSTTLTHGDHDLTATYTDPAGNESDPSSALTVTIDTMAPAAPGTPDLAATSDSGISDTDDITSDNTPTITGTGGTPGDTVTLYDTDGTTVLGTVTVAPDGSWSIDSTTLTDGDHDLTATYTDPAGNESDPSGVLTVTVVNPLSADRSTFNTTSLGLRTMGASDWESFTFNGEQYLVAANYSEGSSSSINSVVYKWNGSSFESVFVQPTKGARDWESFTIGGEQFLAVANSYDSSVGGYSLNSTIYRWDGTAGDFVLLQTIATSGAMDWESFTINGEQYLAVANNYDGTSYNQNSEIYRWDSTAGNFVLLQSIATQGARDWESFTVNGVQYLAVANNTDGSSGNINSVIYRWDSTAGDFVLLQTIATSGAMDWESFTINGEQYLAVANNYDGTSYNQNSEIYRWDSTAGNFVLLQSIATQGARDWGSFTVNGVQYLAVANNTDGSSGNINSVIYRWDGSSFVELQSISTSSAFDWESFTLGGEQYLAVANGWQLSPASAVPDGSADGAGGTFTVLGGAYGVAVTTIGSRTYALVGSAFDDGVQIIDVTDPFNPVATAAVTDEVGGFTELDSAREIVITTIGSNTYAVATARFDDGVQIIDITDPSNPVATAAVTDGVGGFTELDGANGIAITTIGSNIYALVASYNDAGFQIIDITDPANPVATAAVTDNAGGFTRLAGAYEVATTTSGGNTYALVASFYDDGVQIIDITDPSNPVASGALTDGVDGFTELDGANGIAITTIGTQTYALVAAQVDDGIQIIDITDPLNPVATAAVTDGVGGFTELDGANGITITTLGAKTYAIVGSILDDGVQIIDITDPANPVATTALSDGVGGYTELDGASKVTTATIGTHTYAFVGSLFDNGVQIIDLGSSAGSNGLGVDSDIYRFNTETGLFELATETVLNLGSDEDNAVTVTALELLANDGGGATAITAVSATAIDSSGAVYADVVWDQTANTITVTPNALADNLAEGDIKDIEFTYTNDVGGVATVTVRLGGLDNDPTNGGGTAVVGDGHRYDLDTTTAQTLTLNADMIIGGDSTSQDPANEGDGEINGLGGYNEFTTATGWADGSYTLGATPNKMQVVVDGDGSDSLTLEDVVWSNDGTVDFGGNTYDVYNHNTLDIQVLVDADINTAVI